jgi:RNA polymerase sigma factor (sigma-70 family)
VIAAIGNLPEREQEVITLRYYGELRMSGIADVMEVSPRTVSRLMNSGVSRLREALESGHRDTEPE